jgi:hypothetical protein
MMTVPSHDLAVMKGVLGITKLAIEARLHGFD